MWTGITLKNDSRKTLLWLDTILCDAETDPEIIERYYQRFIQTVNTIGNQDLPDYAELIFTVHLSRDKAAYHPRITDQLKTMKAVIDRNARVHVYDHPTQGYSLPTNPHIDQIKNPNKQPQRREKLFRDASVDIDFSQFKAVVRISMDDDDLYYPGHLVQVLEASTVLLDLRPGIVSAAGFYRSYLVHVEDSGVTVDDVLFNKIIPGNKFYVIPPEHYGHLETFSPWSLPESMDIEAVERFAAKSVHLALIRNNAPTFAYMRRSQNLSGQSKAGYIDIVHSRQVHPKEQAFLSNVIESPTPKSLQEIIDIPLPRIFRMGCRRNASSPEKIEVSTNFSKMFDSSCQIAFYLMKGGDRLDVRWYSSKDSAVFESRLSGVSIRAFVKKDGKIIHRAASSKIKG